MPKAATIAPIATNISSSTPGEDRLAAALVRIASPAEYWAAVGSEAVSAASAPIGGPPFRELGLLPPNIAPEGGGLKVAAVRSNARWRKRNSHVSSSHPSGENWLP